ncbi:MAG: hypothetical protein KAJ07_00840 [Planctomycetes bacterium]|nr:hypothetical protein [Planctomycetota bacterium]
MNAWLITWHWHGEHAKRKNTLVGIISSRRGEKFVADFVEQAYLMEMFTIEKIIHWANRKKERPYKVKKVEMINNIPHGERITCGLNPHIYARPVTDLKVVSDLENEIEKISWKEPPNFRWINGNRFEGVEVAQEGKLGELEVSYH